MSSTNIILHAYFILANISWIHVCLQNLECPNGMLIKIDTHSFRTLPSWFWRNVSSPHISSDSSCDVSSGRKVVQSPSSSLVSRRSYFSISTACYVYSVGMYRQLLFCQRWNLSSSCVKTYIFRRNVSCNFLFGKPNSRSFANIMVLLCLRPRRSFLRRYCSEMVGKCTDRSPNVLLSLLHELFVLSKVMSSTSSSIVHAWRIWFSRG